MEKLRALAKLCSKEFFYDPSLFVAVTRRGVRGGEDSFGEVFGGCVEYCECL